MRAALCVGVAMTCAPAVSAEPPEIIRMTAASSHTTGLPWVGSVDDLRGRKILTPGPTAAWLEGTGAVAVDGGLTTYYTQIQTGVADGVLTILTGAPPYRIHEVARYITLVGIGAQLTGGISINLDTWRALPEPVQQILAELSHEYSAGIAAELDARYQRALDQMQAEGAIVYEFPSTSSRSRSG